MICLLWLAIQGFVSQVAALDLRENLPYGTHPAQVLDLCRPEAGAMPRPRTGNVVLVHGGGWTGGDKAPLTPLCKTLAEKGHTVISVNYRLADGSAAHAWPAQRDDVLAALRWMKAQGYMVGAPAKVCFVGFSAGGHISAKIGEVDPATLAIAGGVTFSCIVDNFGPIDLVAETADKLRPAICRLVAAPEAETCRERAAALSRMAITRTYPRTLVIQGKTDQLVPPSQSENFAKALQNAGVNTRLILYDGGHSYERAAPETVRGLWQAQYDFIADAFQ